MLLFKKHYLDTTPVNCSTLGKFFNISGKRLEEWYRCHLSGFHEWSEREHADKWLVFPENIGDHLSIDETALSYDELYTIVTNKAAKGKKGAIVAIVKGVQGETVIEALQQMRIDYRWQALDQENKERALAKETKSSFIPKLYENGDTSAQLLIRSRYLLFKTENKWTPTQRIRAEVLFNHYPALEQAYQLTMGLRHIYHTTNQKGIAFTRLAKWYQKVEKSGFEHFKTVLRTLYAHYETILNYFDRRSTNASAESFIMYSCTMRIASAKASGKNPNHILLDTLTYIDRCVVVFAT